VQNEYKVFKTKSFENVTAYLPASLEATSTLEYAAMIYLPSYLPFSNLQGGGSGWADT